MRITKNNLSTHINKLIHKEETTLEHLLVNQDRALSLSSHNQEDRQQVGSKSRPRSISNRHDRAIQKGVNLIMLMSRNKDIITSTLNSNS
ncbi:hypothetical protein SDC9_165403 [bioreactor metagenome]|uniref:Uncharacterized protein n=1 Tax=bioreactor metagenome TaxID=1076179 RepID=A0A645FUB3_9ZZZZ